MPDRRDGDGDGAGDGARAGPRPPCVLRPGARFEGLFALRAPGTIEGELSGEVIATDLLWIGRSARVDARIVAAEIVIAGEFDGEALASDRIELLETARVRATLDARCLVLAEGSFFEGRCRTRFDADPGSGFGGGRCGAGAAPHTRAFSP